MHKIHTYIPKKKLRDDFILYENVIEWKVTDAEE